jgi:hypothetical protein
MLSRTKSPSSITVDAVVTGRYPIARSARVFPTASNLGVMPDS